MFCVIIYIYTYTYTCLSPFIYIYIYIYCNCFPSPRRAITRLAWARRMWKCCRHTYSPSHGTCAGLSRTTRMSRILGRVSAQTARPNAPSACCISLCSFLQRHACVARASTFVYTLLIATSPTHIGRFANPGGVHKREYKIFRDSGFDGYFHPKDGCAPGCPIYRQHRYRGHIHIYIYIYIHKYDEKR